MPQKLVGPLAGMHLANGDRISLLCEPGYEGRIKNCSDLYLVKAQAALRSKPDDAPNPCVVALDPAHDGPHVFALLAMA